MNFGPVEYLQFYDELYFLNQEKEFRGTFLDGLKGQFKFQDVVELLENKRKAYNFAYTNIYRSYGIASDDLYVELDCIWAEFVEPENVDSHILDILLLSPAFLPVHLFNYIRTYVLSDQDRGNIIEFQITVKRAWENYMVAALKYAKVKGKEQIDDESS